MNGRLRRLVLLLVLLVGPAGAAATVVGQPTVAVGVCSGRPTATCLHANFGGVHREFPLSDNSAAKVIALGLIGRTFGGSLPAAFVYWQTGENASGSSGPLVALSIFDLNGRGAVARVSPPAPDPARHFEGYSVNDTYFGVLQGPGALRYPFLAPGQRYLNLPHWDYLCRFDTAAIAAPEPGCGAGFKRIPASFRGADTKSGFRHNGGWLEDEDGDGWQDINLPFLRYILVISGRTGTTVALLHPDLTRQSEPDTPDDFDSGRLYGSFTPFTSSDGKRDVLIAAGNVVGTFDDVNCNVSRYYAALETAVPDDPASRNFKWSDYISFTKNIFSRAASHAETPNPVLRRGDLLNRCVHRVSTSVFHVGARPITLFNEFTEVPLLPPDTCLEEQWHEWRDNFPPDEMTAWTNCARKAALPATGSWTVHVLELDHGKQVAAAKNSYAWGRVDNLVPQQREVFVIETTRERLRFDQQGYHPLELHVVGLDAGFGWHDYGALPGTTRPRMNSTGPNSIPYEGPVGSSWGGIREIQTRQRPEGLVDIQLEDGTWVGYSADRHAFVVEP